jgi:hypothetical protein
MDITVQDSRPGVNIRLPLYLVNAMNEAVPGIENAGVLLEPNPVKGGLMGAAKEKPRVYPR